MDPAARHPAPRVWLIIVALVGLTVLQVLLLRFAWELKTRSFVNNVTTALTVTAANLETEEIFVDAVESFRVEVGGSDSQPSLARRFIRLDRPEGQAPRPRMHAYTGNTLVHTDTLSIPAGHRVWHVMEDDDQAYGYHFETECVTVETDEPGHLAVIVQTERDDLIRRIVGDLVTFEPKPIRERLARAGIDSLLTANLAAAGVDAVPEYGVFAADTDSLVYAPDGTRDEDLASPTYKARLFPLDPAPPHYDLALHFPDRRVYLAGQMWPFWLASIVFMSIIVHSFVRTLRAHAAQRRYAEHLVDFVNNMTHEFKTPLSTVSLASEALERPDIAERPDALHRYNRMIRDENRRMVGQVEKILQLARLESGDFRLNRAPVDLDALVADAAGGFALQVERSDGELIVEAGAGGAQVDADAVHLGAAVANLVDNAVKYAEGPPRVCVATRREGDELVVEVADRGPGVPEADRERVFEKYFRGHTGNRHDVKGFGLGLSYVRLVAEAHGGTVRLDARSGGGAVAALRLPVSETGGRS